MHTSTLNYLTNFERNKAKTKYDAQMELYKIQVEEQQKQMEDHNMMPEGLGDKVEDEQPPIDDNQDL